VVSCPIASKQDFTREEKWWLGRNRTAELLPDQPKERLKGVICPEIGLNKGTVGNISFVDAVDTADTVICSELGFLNLCMLIKDQTGVRRSTIAPIRSLTTAAAAAGSRSQLSKRQARPGRLSSPRKRRGSDRDTFGY